jgi:hypothetical protein
VQQIVEAVTNTCMKLAHDYGPWVAGAVLLTVAAGVGLRVVARLMRSRPSHPPV